MNIEDSVSLDFNKLTQLIDCEKKHQLNKWGIQNHELNIWALIFNEEVGELNRAILEQQFGNNRSTENIKKELIQVITVACNILNGLLKKDKGVK